MSTAISVVIPTLNRASYLVQALDSALAQDYRNMEVIVADNASDDATESVVQPYLSDLRVRYLRRPENIGMVNNWRDAVYNQCRGDWFMILSDDDYLSDSQYLSRAAELIARHPSLLIVYAGGIVLDEQTGIRTELRLPFPEKVDGKTVFLSRGKVQPQDFTLCNVLFNRAAALALQPFANPLNLTCDTELFLMLALQGDVGVITEPVSVYRTTGSNNLLLVMRDPDLIIHGNDSLIGAYLHARKLGVLDDAELLGWRHRVIDGALKIALKRLRRHAPKRIPDFFAYLHARSPELFWSSSRHFPFKVGLRAAAWYLRRSGR